MDTLVCVYSIEKARYSGLFFVFNLCHVLAGYARYCCCWEPFGSVKNRLNFSHYGLINNHFDKFILFVTGFSIFFFFIGKKRTFLFNALCKAVFIKKIGARRASCATIACYFLKFQIINGGLPPLFLLL